MTFRYMPSDPWQWLLDGGPQQNALGGVQGPDINAIQPPPMPSLPWLNKRNLIDKLAGLPNGANVDPDTLKQARQQGLLNAGLSLLASGGKQPMWGRPNLGQALQMALAQGQGGYGQVLQAAQGLQQQKDAAARDQQRQRIISQYDVRDPQQMAQLAGALAAFDGDAGALSNAANVYGAMTKPPKPGEPPKWQQEGYPSFEAWRADQTAGNRPEWQKQGYPDFAAWQADKHRTAAAGGEASIRAARGQALTDWRSAISGDNDAARVLSSTEGALAELAANPNNETAKTALARGVAAMFNKGALSDNDVAAFAFGPGVAGDVQKMENWLKSNRLSADQIENFRGLLRSVRGRNYDRVESDRAAQAETWQTDPRYFRNPYETPERRAALEAM